MGKRKNIEDLFKGRHFESELIILCVRWYLRYKLSYRDVVEMMAERGLSLAHTTILRLLCGKQCWQHDLHSITTPIISSFRKFAPEP